MEAYHQGDFQEAGLTSVFVQDNQSQSLRGVLRGLHFQQNHPQGKLVRVLSGEVFDVAVDIRPYSQTFGKWFGVTLSAENQKQLYLPEGFAHGFLVLSSSCELLYKCTEFYHPEDDRGIRWNDPQIGVQWPLELTGQPLLSKKDQALPSWASVTF
jgi:dTDP-4-dehydrorhamnose 3,5-epimerase